MNSTILEIIHYICNASKAKHYKYYLLHLQAQLIVKTAKKYAWIPGATQIAPFQNTELTCTADPEEENAEYTAINALEELELSIIAALYSSLYQTS